MGKPTSDRHRLDAPDPDPFGYTLMLDLYGCRRGAADDLSLCYDFLIQLVTELKMQMQSPPFIFISDAAKYPDKAGLSGWVPLIESGIQIHTLSVKNFISIDVYCCRAFAHDTIVGLARKYFVFQECELNSAVRGVKYNTVI